MQLAAGRGPAVAACAPQLCRGNCFRARCDRVPSSEMTGPRQGLATAAAIALGWVLIGPAAALGAGGNAATTETYLRANLKLVQVARSISRPPNTRRSAKCWQRSAANARRPAPTLRRTPTRHI